MAIQYAVGAPIMMQLGGYQFGLNTAAYQGLSRSDDWRWPVQERIGQEQALQFVGPGASTITLDGVVFPEWRGGLGQLDAMRLEAAKGVPLVLVDGRGGTHGMWVIERIDETQSVFAAGGLARRVEFSMQLRRYTQSVAGPVPTIAPLPALQQIAVPETAPIEQRAHGLAEMVSKAAGPLLATASGAYRTLRARIEPGMQVLSDAAGAAQRCAEVAQRLQHAGDRAQALLKGRGRAQQIVRRMSERVGVLRTHAESAQQILQRTAARIERAPQEAIRAVTEAGGCARDLDAVCRRVLAEAGRIIERQ